MLLWLLFKDGTESPLLALALALPVRLRTFFDCGGWRELTPACCSTWWGATELPCPGGYRGTGCCIPFGGDGRPFIPLIDGLYWAPGDWLVRRG